MGGGGIMGCTLYGIVFLSARSPGRNPIYNALLHSAKSLIRDRDNRLWSAGIKLNFQQFASSTNNGTTNDPAICLCQSRESVVSLLRPEGSPRACVLARELISVSLQLLSLSSVCDVPQCCNSRSQLQLLVQLQRGLWHFFLYFHFFFFATHPRTSFNSRICFLAEQQQGPHFRWLLEIKTCLIHTQRRIKENCGRK